MQKIAYTSVCRKMNITLTDCVYETLANRIKLLAHPERLRILDLLRNGPECVCDIEALLDKPQPYISQQLRLLRKANLIAAEKRGLYVYYRLVDVEMTAWLDQLLGPMKQSGHPDMAGRKRVMSCHCDRCC